MRGKSLRWVLAGVLECLILVGFAFWIQHFTESPKPFIRALIHHRVIHWIRQVQPTPITPPRQRIPHQAIAVPTPPPLRLGSGPSGLAGLAVRVEVQRGSLLQALPNPGAGDGVMHGISVNIPIPGGGGLPATPYRVKLISWGPVPHKRNVDIVPPRYIWIEGYVNQSGRVVRLTVLQSQLGESFIYLTKIWIRSWRFAPLSLHGHHSGFHIVIPLWWRHVGTAIPTEHLRHPLFALHTRSDFGGSNELLNQHWVLYPIPGHHPLAVLLALGSYPILDVAQATTWAVLRIERRLQAGDTRP